MIIGAILIAFGSGVVAGTAFMAWVVDLDDRQSLEAPVDGPWRL